MTELPQGFNRRRPGAEDAQAVHALMVACDIAQYGEPDTDLNDLLADWADMDLNKDAWLVIAPDGRLAGYASLQNQGNNRFFLQSYADSADETGDLCRCLVATAEQAAQIGAPGQITMRTIVASVNHRDQRVLAAAGYQLKKHYLRMMMEMAAPPATPSWPPGITLRHIIPGQDDEILFHFIMTAFDWPGREASTQTFAEWQSFMMRPDHFIPELWFLAFAGDELVTAALCYNYDEYGWVRQLATRRDWRGQGLGTAMLRHVFGVFYTRGHRRVALGVEAVNTGAQAFYERVGMALVRQFDEYQKRIP